MKKVALRLFAIVVAVSLIGVLSGFSDNEPADVIKDLGCVISTPWGGGFTIETIQVANHGGNVTLSCHFRDLYNPSGEVWQDSDFPCGTTYGLATKSFKVVSPDGNALLRCQIKKAKD